MKLKNKKTGEIVDVLELIKLDGTSNEFYLRLSDNEGRTFKVGFNSFAEVNAVWKDYKEPKDYWCIDWTEDGGIFHPNHEDRCDDFNKEIGNYFNTREEAEKAVEKLKAWKRLKDDGLKIRKYELNGGTDRDGCFTGDVCLTLDISKPVYEDILQLLFGSEE